MSFNSSSFLIFFTAVYLLYLLLGRWLRLQNLLLLAASYIFYSFGGWRWLILVLFSTLLDYTVGRLLGKTSGRAPGGTWLRRLLLTASVLGNLTVLGVFKYYDFFAENLQSMFRLAHLSLDLPMLKLIAPLGISFWTLKSMSYSIDVYHGRQQPVRSLVDYALFVALFPTLLSGPLDRARQFLPQITAPRRLTAERLKTGLHLILFGYFKKLVIADNLAARIADPVFGSYLDYAGVDILLGGLAFTFQLYADFSGYTDIARGVAFLLGFETALNFRLPYFALNPTDFWQRWHISFSEWLRDYLFFPIRRAILRWKGSDSALGLLIPPLVTMLLCGLWHGAAWTFVLWGGYHGLLIILYRLLEKKPIHTDPWKSGVAYPWVALRLLLMFFLTGLGWFIFRSGSLGQVFSMLGSFSFAPSANSLNFFHDLVFYTAPLWVMDLAQYLRKDLLVLARLPLAFRLVLNGALLASIIMLGMRGTTEFIYVQF